MKQLIQIEESFTIHQELSLIASLLRNDLSLTELYSLYTSVKVLSVEHPDKEHQIKRYRVKIANLIKTKQKEEKSLSEEIIELISEC